MPFQELENGELHRVLALIDVYLDTPAYNGHTACHDALWANGVLVTVRGKSLAARVGADLLHHFGTPENICDDAASAVARANELLQDPTCLSVARKKADHCRATSQMYDNAHRAEIVIDALVRAFKETVMEQEKDKALGCSASASQHLSDSDVTILLRPSSDRACHLAALPSSGLQASCSCRAISGPAVPRPGPGPVGSAEQGIRVVLLIEP